MDDRNYFVIMGGGIGEVQTTKDCTTPLAAIKEWVRGQNPRGKYTAPMDTWITCPDIYDDKWNNIGVDMVMIRAFYAWCGDNHERLEAEINKQDVYVTHYLMESIAKKAVWVRDATDAELTKAFEYDYLHPFAGG